MQTRSLLIKAQNTREELQITIGETRKRARRYYEKQPLLRYPPGRRPLDTFSEWRRYV